MKKAIFFISLIFLNLLVVNASDINLEVCKYSEEYIEWLKLSDEEKANTIMPPMCLTDETKITLSSSNNYSLSSFSLKDQYVLGVRNQENTEDCWAFSTLASIESNLLKNNYQTDYLSVAHLELMTQDSLYSNLKTFHRDFNAGGRFAYTSAYVLNYWGPIEENTLPFSTLTNIINNQNIPSFTNLTNKKATVDVDNIFTLTNEQKACSASSIEAIKKYLVNYGALAANVYFTFDTNDLTTTSTTTNGTDIKGQFLNGEYYYYDGSSYENLAGNTIAANQLPNHAVTIIGWDDNIEITSFSTNAQRKGAWLVKNSYGQDLKIEVANGVYVDVNMGDEGYYYISYDDINICSNVVGYYNADFNVSDNVYYYDYLGANMNMSSQSNTNYIANIFTKSSSQAEKLDKITFATSMAKVKYTVYYASNASLTNFEQIASGTTTHEGYLSVIPNKDIYVKDQFSIIIKLETDDATEDIIPVAMSSTNQDNPYYNYKLTDSVSYISVDGNKWLDMSSLSIGENNFLKVQNSIRAYTTIESKNVDNTVDTNKPINNSVSSEIYNPNESVDSGNLTDSVNEEEIENPQTGYLTGVTWLFLFCIAALIIRLKIKNKVYKI